MKVVALKNIPEVPAPGAAEPTDGYSGPVHRTRQTIIEPGESANFNCSIVNFSQGCNTGWHIHDCDQILIVTSGSGGSPQKPRDARSRLATLLTSRQVSATGTGPKPIPQWAISPLLWRAAKPPGAEPCQRTEHLLGLTQ